MTSAAWAQNSGAELRDAVITGDVPTVTRLLAKAKPGPSDLGALLRDAAYWGRTPIAKLLLDRGANANAATPAGWTPLMAAARRGHADIAQMLLDHGANPKARETLESDYGLPGNPPTVRKAVSALYVAAEAGHSDVVELLAAKGADAGELLPPGQTALIAAIRNGRSGAVRVLMQRGAKLETEDFNGNTPLLVAAAAGNDAILKELVEKRADVTRSNSKHETALFLAVQTGNREAVRTLLARKADPNPSAAGHPAPLLEAVRRNDLEMAGILVAAGANVGLANEDGSSVFASMAKTPEMAALLTKSAATAGLDTNTLFAPKNAAPVVERSNPPQKFDTSLDDPLIEAARQGDLALVNSLLQRGASPIYRDSYDRVALVVAAEKGHSDVVASLFDHGAGLEMPALRIWTPLMEAAKNGHLETVKLLVDRGAALWNRDGSGQTAADLAFKFHRNDVADFLASHGGGRPMPPMLIEAARGGDMATLKLLIEDEDCAKFFKPFVSDAVFAAAQSGQSVALKYLLRFGADINQRGHNGGQFNETGSTALMAVLAGPVNQDGGLRFPEMVPLLIAAGADVNPPGRSGPSPLALARRIRNPQMRAQIVEQLVKAGAKE
jgi:ankyrin repeat protein